MDPGVFQVAYISGYLMPRSYAMSLYALQAISMLSVPPDVTWLKKKKKVLSELWILKFKAHTGCKWMFIITCRATGVRSTMEKCAGHSHNLCLHLSHTRKDVWVKRVAPCKISIYLCGKDLPNICTTWGKIWLFWRNKQELFTKYKGEMRHSFFI